MTSSNVIFRLEDVVLAIFSIFHLMLTRNQYLFEMWLTVYSAKKLF